MKYLKNRLKIVTPRPLHFGTGILPIIWPLMLKFFPSLVIPPNGKVLGSKLDTDVHTSSCRLAFEGQMVHTFSSEKYKSEDLKKLKIFKLKEKVGLVERANNDYELIGELYERFVHKWAILKYQSQSTVIEVMLYVPKF